MSKNYLDEAIDGVIESLERGEDHVAIELLILVGDTACKYQLEVDWLNEKADTMLRFDN